MTKINRNVKTAIHKLGLDYFVLILYAVYASLIAGMKDDKDLL